MTIEPRRPHHASDVARLFDVDLKLLKKLSNYGPPTHVFKCTWRGKPSGIALTVGSVVLAAAGMTGGVGVGQYGWASLQLATPTSGRLRLFDTTHDVTFFSAQDASACKEAIEQGNEGHRIKTGRKQPVVLRDGERLVPSCTYVGGAYLPLQHQESVDLVFRESSLELYRSPVTNESLAVSTIPFSAKFALDLGGPGKVTKGGGFFGGGLGLVGAVEGMAIAAVLNSLTTRTSIISVLIVGDDKHEGFFVNTQAVPEELRRHLSPVFVRLRHQSQAAAIAPTGAQSDLASQIERLAALHQAEALTDAEFAEAKAALMRSL